MDLDSYEPTEVDFDGKLHHPFSMIVSGASSSGKSSLLLNMLDTFHDSIDLSSVNNVMPEIYYVYSIPQTKFDKYKSWVKFFHGFEHDELRPDSLRNKENIFLILDDTTDEICPRLLKNIFTKDSHHKKISICAIVHNPYDSSISTLRTCTLNSHFYLLARSPQSLSSTKHLFIQLFPGQAKQVMKLYNDIIETPYRFLLIDNSPRSNLKYRLRSNLFCKDQPQEVYILNKKNE